jgi:hypothetical protein
MMLFELNVLPLYLRTALGFEPLIALHGANARRIEDYCEAGGDMFRARFSPWARGSRWRGTSCSPSSPTSLRLRREHARRGVRQRLVRMVRVSRKRRMMHTTAADRRSLVIRCRPAGVTPSSFLGDPIYPGRSGRSVRSTEHCTASLVLPIKENADLGPSWSVAPHWTSW